MKTINNNTKNYTYNINKDIIQIRSKLQSQVEFFNTGKTKEIKFRIEELRKFKNVLKNREADIMEALYNDLKKSQFESYISEIVLAYQEINHALANIKKWAKPKKQKTPFFLLPAKSWTVPEPYGQVLIIGTWNYPFQLVIVPLVNAIAAGNVVVIKPSKLATYTSGIVTKIVSEAFDPSFVYVVEGGVERAQFLLSEPFDYIFFTGGAKTGKTIMEAASRHLTPVTLELGGKNPAIINSDAAIDSAAKRIAWGKFINAGQTCIAPDYLLVHKDIAAKLTERIEHYVKKFYGGDAKTGNLARIININHFRRVKDLIKNANIVFGGQISEKHLHIAPTIVRNISLKHPLMKEEIFGPVLPVLEFRNIDDAVSIVKSMPKPLALYLFTSNKNLQRRISNEISSGALMINDNIMHIANYYLPFGGVGASGMGAYHGKAGFDTFSHKKPVMKGSRFLDLPFRYPTFEKMFGLLKFLLG